MTVPTSGTTATVRLVRKLVAPVARRLDAVRDLIVETRQLTDVLGARVDQLSRQVERLEAYQRVSRDEVASAFASLTTTLSGSTSDQSPGEILQRRLDHGLLHAEALNAETRAQLERDVADLRSQLRLTQALAERAASGSPAPAGDAQEGDRPTSAPTDVPVRAFEHPVPSFDLLYRAFEDRHRGDVPTIASRQREDYLELLGELPNPQLPVVDLGCGRGELVQLLVDAGHAALGVDSNLGQVADGDPGLFAESDLFDWLDTCEDGSVRAVVALHVIEHLPLDLQIRLVFEARRVLAEGGLLVLETPNLLSLSTAATNFWVDPTHQRPVHPLFLEFLAEEAGFVRRETRFLHDLPVGFRGAQEAPQLVEDLDSLIFGAGDAALLAWR
jgi:SAM-dependent methyltransferase